MPFSLCASDDLISPLMLPFVGLLLILLLLVAASWPLMASAVGALEGLSMSWISSPSKSRKMLSV